MSQTDDAVQAVAKSLQELRDARMLSLAEVRNLHGASRMALQAEASRLSARYGADDPRTLRMKARVVSTAANARAMESAAERLAGRPTVPVQGEAVVEGRVTDEFGRGLPSVSVALADGKGARIRFVEPVVTALAGYFAFRLPEDLVKRLLESNADGVLATVLDQSGKSVHVTDRPIRPEPGSITSVDIILRRSAVPPKGRSTAPPAENGDATSKKPKKA